MELQTIAHCPTHDRDYPRTGACPACVISPAGIPEMSEDRDEESRRNESRCYARADVLWSEYEAQIALADWHSHNVAAKLSDCAVKWERLAKEWGEERRSREHDLKLVRHEREMSGRGRAH